MYSLNPQTCDLKMPDTPYVLLTAGEGPHCVRACIPKESYDALGGSLRVEMVSAIFSQTSFMFSSILLIFA